MSERSERISQLSAIEPHDGTQRSRSAGMSGNGRRIDRGRDTGSTDTDERGRAA